MPNDEHTPVPDQDATTRATRMRAIGDGELPLPTQIGPYSLRRRIASGGMGTVYEAQQEKPRRRVALKLMRQGIASPSILRRFEFESQTLARLRHPGIAQVYDAGTHDDGDGGVPYFAMEYIPSARSLTEYSKSKKLSTRERLDLFARVCDAVHHGHQKGVIHRDLKPGNILVDSAGQPKVIDFGVARATDSDMAVTTVQTEVGQIIGTLQYMSPEQCDADPTDLDTRSDVYALGVLLYELVCGCLPYDLSGTAIYEAVRVIREDTPASPSTTAPGLSRDLVTMIIKAMEKDREQRYRSAQELGDDVRRYLADEPISARRPGLSEQLRRFSRKHRALVAASCSVIIVVVAALVLVSFFAYQANELRVEAERERGEAEAARAELARVYSDLARKGALVGTPIEGRLVVMSGRVQYRVTSVDPWQVATSGTVIRAGYEVKTELNSSVTVDLGVREVEISQSSIVSFPVLVDTEPKPVIRLLVSRGRVDVKTDASDADADFVIIEGFQITTPSSKLEVRG